MVADGFSRMVIFYYRQYPNPGWLFLWDSCDLYGWTTQRTYLPMVPMTTQGGFPCHDGPLRVWKISITKVDMFKKPKSLRFGVCLPEWNLVYFCWVKYTNHTNQPHFLAYLPEWFQFGWFLLEIHVNMPWAMNPPWERSTFCCSLDVMTWSCLIG